MAAKLHTKKTISLKNGAAATGKTIPGPGSVRGGGQTAKQANGGKGSGGGMLSGGFGTARGLQKGRGC